VGGQHHSPAALPPEKKPGTDYTREWAEIGRKLNVPQKFTPYWGWNPDLLARSQSLYRVSDKDVDKLD
jgi:hypothetical protein